MSASRDNGLTWTTPKIVDTPDSRAKQSAGNLPKGSASISISSNNRGTISYQGEISSPEKIENK